MDIDLYKTKISNMTDHELYTHALFTINNGHDSCAYAMALLEELIGRFGSIIGMFDFEE